MGRLRNEPIRVLSLPVDFSAFALEEFLRDCYYMGGSDINIQSNDAVYCDIEGKWTRVTDRRLEPTEVERALGFLYEGGAVGNAKLLDGTPLDFAVRIGEEQGDIDNMIRFRSNATAGYINGVDSGIAITLRTIPGTPPTWGMLNPPKEISDNFFMAYGLGLVIGTTGSGKSTLLAAANRRRIEEGHGGPVKILCYEDPIEYVYDGLAKEMPAPMHVQVGRDLESFGDAGKNAMRRKGNVIIMGESRDRESVAACFEMALSGHAVYSTLHADTPAQVFSRMVSFFPEDAQPAKANELLDTLRIIVAQKLYRGTDGKKHAVQSWLINDREAYDRLESVAFSQRGALVRTILEERGASFELQCLPAVRDGLMSPETFRTVCSMTNLEASDFFRRHGLGDFAELLRAGAEA